MRAREAVEIRVYLIRHGQPEALDGQKRCIGRTNLPLSHAGMLQAEEAAIYLADKGICALYASPLIRAADTARIIGHRLRLPVFYDADLQELDAGQWDGLTFSEIASRWPQLYAQRGLHIGTCPPPDGESFQTAGERLSRALHRICASESGNIAIISHSGAARGWLCRELGLPSDDVLRLPQPYGGITAADWTGAGFRILYCGMQPGVISKGSAASA